MATRILFVEDERSISEPFAKALTREGFEPTVAATAADALALAQEIEPDLVLLDLNLPDGDGRDVARELRRRGDVPILMLTARGSEMDRVVGLELGADDYVVKPFSSAEVIARIRAVLRRVSRGGRAATSRPRSATWRSTRVCARRRLDGRELDLTRKEFDLLVRLARDAPNVVAARGPDRRRVGPELVRLDEDARRSRRARCAASWARTRELDPHGARCRVPLRDAE